MDELPNEILAEILAYVHHKDIFNSCLYINTKWYYLIKSFPDQFWITIIHKELNFLEKYTLVEIDGFGYLLVANGTILSFGDKYNCNYVEPSMKFRLSKEHLVEDIYMLYRKFGSKMYEQIIGLNKIVLYIDLLGTQVVKISNYVNLCVLIEGFNFILKRNFKKIMLDDNEYDFNQILQYQKPFYIGEFKHCMIF